MTAPWVSPKTRRVPRFEAYCYSCGETRAVHGPTGHEGERDFRCVICDSIRLDMHTMKELK
jgi:hypothetical protein